MSRLLKRRLSIVLVALAAIAAAGGAYAATRSGGSGGSLASQQSAFLSDVAKRLGVSEAQLKAALQGAFDDQLNAAVAAGRLTRAQANAIRQRMQQRGFVPFGPPPELGLRQGFDHGGFSQGPGAAFGGGPLQTAAGYLGLTNAQLVQQLAGEKSLADIARSRGKSVSGLKQALGTALKSRLDKAVSAKLISRSQERQLFSRLSARLDQEINQRGGRRFGFRHGPAGFGPGPRGLPGASGFPLPQSGDQPPDPGGPPVYGPPGDGSTAGSASTPY